MIGLVLLCYLVIKFWVLSIIVVIFSNAILGHVGLVFLNCLCVNLSDNICFLII